MREFVFVAKKYKGGETRRELTVRQAKPDDAAALEKLELDILDMMPDKGLFVPTLGEDLVRQIREHWVAALWDGETPVAYVSVEYRGRAENHYGWDLGLAPEEMEHWACLDTTVVHPDWRGNNLQQEMIKLAERELRPGMRGMACTVSPFNLHSLRNVEACGFDAACRKKKYGGLERLVMKKELA